MTFNNSILSGTTLVRERITSEGFDSGNTGWSIDRDGNAEFNDITARGQIESVGVNTTSRLTAGSLVIEENANPVTLSRLTQSTLEFQDGNTNEKANLEFDAGIPLIGFTAPITTVRGVHFHGNLGYLVGQKDSFPAVELEEWTAIPASNGYTGGSYYKLPDGNVMLDGAVAGGAAASPVVVGVLPAGYRPRAYAEYMVARGGAFGTNKITVETNGNITQWTNDATYTSSLAGIIFSTLA